MADNVSLDDMRKEFERQIADLKKEIGSINRSLADRGSAAYDRAREATNDAYGRAREQANTSLRQARQQAQLVTDTVRENPGTAATVLSSAGIIGFLLGFAIGTAMNSESSRHW